MFQSFSKHPCRICFRSKIYVSCSSASKCWWSLQMCSDPLPKMLNPISQSSMAKSPWCHRNKAELFVAQWLNSRAQMRLLWVLRMERRVLHVFPAPTWQLYFSLVSYAVLCIFCCGKGILVMCITAGKTIFTNRKSSVPNSAGDKAIDEQFKIKLMLCLQQENHIWSSIAHLHSFESSEVYPLNPAK